MEKSSDPALERLVSCCGKGGIRGIRGSDYIDYIGLPQINKIPTSGRPQFSDTTGQVDKFNKATITLLNHWVKRFKTRNQLEQVAKCPSIGLLAELEDRISTYGPIIWGASDSRLAVDSNKLRFENPDDRKRITRCVFYWVLHRALRKIPSKLSTSAEKVSGAKQAFRKTPKKTSHYNPRESQHGLSRTLLQTEDDTSSEYVEEENRSSSEHDTIESQASADLHLQGVGDLDRGGQREYPVPVANMGTLPTRTMMTRGSTNQTEAFVVGQRIEARSDLIRNISESSESEIILGAHESDNPRSSRTIKRRGGFMPDEPLTLTDKRILHKRARLMVNNSPDRDTFGKDSTVEPDRPLISADRLYPSPEEDTHVPSSPVNFPRLAHIYDGEVNGNEMPVIHGLPRTPKDTSGTETMPDTVIETIDSDDDSVFGVTAEPDPVTSQGSHPSLIAKLRLNHEGALTLRPPIPEHVNQATWSRLDHNIFSSKLLVLLETCDPGQQDVAEVEQVLVYIHRIRKIDDSWLSTIYGEAYEKYKLALTNWSGCLERLIAFRESFGFTKDHHTLAAYIKTLPKDTKRLARRSVMDTKAVTAYWQKETTIEDFCKALAEVTLKMTTYKDMMDLDELEELFVRFNMKLLALFN